jgi:hypothetical protein
MKLNRRHLLRASLTAGAVAVTQLSWTKSGETKLINTADRQQSPNPHQTAQLAPTEINLAALKTSKLLMQCCRLAASQTDFSSQNSAALIAAQAVNPVSSQPLEASAKIFDHYTQIAWFQSQISNFYEPQFHGVALKVSDRAAIYGKPQNFGLALRSPQHNVIALHATQSDAEWLQYSAANLSCFNSHQLNRGQVHSRVKQLHDRLKPQIQAAIQQFDPALPCYVTGYSLGGAIAHLAAVEIALSYPQLRENIQVYSFGAPQFGDRPFAEFYDALLPHTYRIINLADCVPALPSKAVYQPVGKAQTYLEQQGDTALNHAIGTYEAAIA